MTSSRPQAQQSQREAPGLTSSRLLIQAPIFIKSHDSPLITPDGDHRCMARHLEVFPSKYLRQSWHRPCLAGTKRVTHIRYTKNPNAGCSVLGRACD